MKINDIIIGTRLRSLDKDNVNRLKDSMAEIGLIEPVVVDKNNNIIAGFHRIGQLAVDGRSLPEIQAEELAKLQREKEAEKRFLDAIKASGDRGMSIDILSIVFPEFYEELIERFTDNGDINEFKQDTYILK